MIKNQIFDWLSRRSVFLKLLVVIILAAVLANLVVITYLQRSNQIPRSNYQQLLERWSAHLLDSFGIPPNFERAREIANTLELKIRYQGREQVWSTANDLPDLEKIEFRPFESNVGLRYGTYDQKEYLILKRGSDVFMITADFIRRSSETDRIRILLIGLLCLIFFGVFFIMRKILQPIQYLKEGVETVGEGNLDHVLPVVKFDELGQLSQAFNTMTKKIRDDFFSKEQLLLNVSHELRSPLTRIKVATEFLPQGKSKDLINEDIDLMEKMLAELLESSRLDSGYGSLQLKRTDFTALITEQCRLVDELTPGTVLEMPSWPVYLFLDAGRIRTVLKNLLDNSIKNSPVDVKTEPIQITLTEAGTSVLLRIKDFGHGIPPEDIPHVFEPFYRVDKSRSKKSGGYGLGLSICKKIIEAHRGTIVVTRRLGRGTEINIELPKEDQAPQAEI